MCIVWEMRPLSPLECRRRSLIGLNAPLSYHKHHCLGDTTWRRIILKSLIEILIPVFRCFDYNRVDGREQASFNSPSLSYPLPSLLSHSFHQSFVPGWSTTTIHTRSLEISVRTPFCLAEGHAAQLSWSCFPTAALVNLHRTFSGIF